MKIAVYAISKNEEKFVERFIKSCQGADYIVIADTGSTDNTVSLAKDLGATVYNISINPWRFDKARDAALSLIPADAEVCISLDLDEVLEDGWREEIERVWEPGTTRLRYFYDWGNDIQFYYEKIHHRNGYYWHHPCHEYPRPEKRIKEVYAHTDKLLVSHHPDNQKLRLQYVDLLRLSIMEDPDCPRNAFYYARELTFHGRWQEAIDQAKKYLDMPSATWHHERCYAMRTIAKSYMYLQDLENAFYWFRRACAEAPHSREPWVDLAQACYEIHHWPECYYACEKALEVVEREYVYTANPECWGIKPYDLASISSWALGMHDRAIEYAKYALTLEPDNQRIKDNLTKYRKALDVLK